MYSLDWWHCIKELHTYEYECDKIATLTIECKINITFIWGRFEFRDIFHKKPMYTFYVSPTEHNLNSRRRSRSEDDDKIWRWCRFYSIIIYYIDAKVLINKASQQGTKRTPYRSQHLRKGFEVTIFIFYLKHFSYMGN